MESKIKSKEKSLQIQRTEGWLQMDERSKKVQTSIMKEVSHGDITYSMVTIVNNTVLHI